MQQIVQNDKNKKILAGWIKSGRFPHAVLIEGQRGSGKKSFGRLIGNTLLCSEENSPCGKCSHCFKIDKNIHPDFPTFSGEGGARSFHVNRVREIRAEAYISPNEAKAKVFLLLNVEEMSIQAQNALLKIIEEPPAGVYFILTCENKSMMLSTIRSRTTALTMEIPDVSETAKYLEGKISGKSSDEYQLAALQAQGNIGTALELLSSGESVEELNTARGIWENLKNGKELEASASLAGYQRNRAGFLDFLEILRSIVSGEILSYSKDNTGKKHNTLQLYKVTDIIDEVKMSVNGNVNMLLLVSLLPFKIRRAIATR